MLARGRWRYEVVLPTTMTVEGRKGAIAAVAARLEL